MIFVYAFVRSASDEHKYEQKWLHVVDRAACGVRCRVCKAVVKTCNTAAVHRNYIGTNCAYGWGNVIAMGYYVSSYYFLSHGDGVLLCNTKLFFSGWCGVVSCGMLHYRHSCTSFAVLRRFLVSSEHLLRSTESNHFRK